MIALCETPHEINYLHHFFFFTAFALLLQVARPQDIGIYPPISTPSDSCEAKYDEYIYRYEKYLSNPTKNTEDVALLFLRAWMHCEMQIVCKDYDYLVNYYFYNRLNVWEVCGSINERLGTPEGRRCVHELLYQTLRQCITVPDRHPAEVRIERELACEIQEVDLIHECVENRCNPENLTPGEDIKNCYKLCKLEARVKVLQCSEGLNSSSPCVKECNEQYEACLIGRPRDPFCGLQYRACIDKECQLGTEEVIADIALVSPTIPMTTPSTVAGP